LKKIKAIASKTDDISDLKNKNEDDDDDINDDDSILGDSDENDMNLNLEKENQNQNDEEKKILNNSAVIESDDEYDDIAEDFQKTMKKLREIAKIYIL